MNEKKIFIKVKEILYSLTGITLADNKELMINNRLQKLQHKLNYSGNLEELLNKIESGYHSTEFINSFTTNKTHFFREVFHFDDMRDRALPELFKKQNSVSIYCSAASTGEEPYSIAMTLMQTMEDLGINIQGTRSSIIATDIDTDVLKFGANGVYRYKTTNKDFPNWIKPGRFFLKKSSDKNSQEFSIKAKNEMKKLLTFSQMNLSDNSYAFREKEFDIIFCRNVLIYFTQDDQKKILKKLFKLLKIGGTFYLGHSENPMDLSSYVKRLGQNIFVKVKDFH